LSDKREQDVQRYDQQEAEPDPDPPGDFAN
jgi:hypothetical protein